MQLSRVLKVPKMNVLKFTDSKFCCPGASASPASASANPQSGEPEADTITLPGDVNPIDSGDGEEVQEG